MNSQTALFYVADTGRTPVVKYLLDHGAKADALDDMGRTAIDVAKVRRGGTEDGSQEIVALLENVR